MKNVIVMGGGPAGLAAGYELNKKGIHAELYEADNQVGGISKTIKYKGYHFDLGGHRFFTKKDVVNTLWNQVLGKDFRNTPRLSRIYYNNHFFNYPLTPMNALFGVGLLEAATILASYFTQKYSLLKRKSPLRNGCPTGSGRSFTPYSSKHIPRRCGEYRVLKFKRNGQRRE